MNTLTFALPIKVIKRHQFKVNYLIDLDVKDTELAKSNQSCCCRCGRKIQKGDLRLVLEDTFQKYYIKRFTCKPCGFKIVRKKLRKMDEELTPYLKKLQRGKVVITKG